MSTHIYSLISLSALLLSSCASHTLNKSHNVSSSGIAYANTVSTLLNLTSDELINVSSSILLIAPHSNKQARQQALLEQNASVSQAIKEIDAFNRHIRLFKRYFQQLQALVDSKDPDDMGQTLGMISGTLARINHQHLEKDPHGYYHRSLPMPATPKQQAHASTAARLLIRAHYAHNIKHALLRDQTIIDQQLELQRLQLRHITRLLKTTLNTGSTLYLNKQVIRPYTKKILPETMHVSWAKKRKKWFEMHRTLVIFEELEEARKALLLAWHDILRGKPDIGSVNTNLKDINLFLQTAHELKHPSYPREYID